VLPGNVAQNSATLDDLEISLDQVGQLREKKKRNRLLDSCIKWEKKEKKKKLN